MKYRLIARLGIAGFRSAHQELAADIVPPLVIVGQARTGTTILHDLLAQDPAARVPLTWDTTGSAAVTVGRPRRCLEVVLARSGR